MPPLTLAILTSVLQMQGSDATITSDNKGIDDLLTAVRGQLQEQAKPNEPRIIEASHHKGYYTKTFTRAYIKYNVGAATGGGTSAKPSGGISVKPTGGSHR